MRFFTKKSCYYQGFFAVKRRAVFILGAMWIALVRGWQSDCVVGGMETRFPMTQSAQSHRQMRSIPRCPKAVFYVFVFDSIDDSATLLNPSPSKFPTEPKKAAGAITSAAGKNYSDVGLLQFGEGCCDACSGFHNVFIAGGVTHANVAWARECITAHGCHVRLVEQVH